MKQTILITGANGLVGKHLSKKLTETGYQIKSLTTNKHRANGRNIFYWNPETSYIDEESLRDVDCIIHLAGANIGESAWTVDRKRIIMESRTQTTALLFQSVIKMGTHLKAYISASATGYYGAITSSEILDEGTTPASDFLGQVCVAWEDSADLFAGEGIRTLKIRTGFVLAKNAPAVNKMLTPVKFGIGSPLGTGSQYMPWIHIDDLCEIFIKAIQDEEMEGAYNAVAPEHVNNKTMMKKLAKRMKRPFFFPPVPAFMLKLLLGEMSLLILEGSRVAPKRLTERGFKFKYPDIDSALADIL